MFKTIYVSSTLLSLNVKAFILVNQTLLRITNIVYEGKYVEVLHMLLRITNIVYEGKYVEVLHTLSSYSKHSFK